MHFCILHFWTNVHISTTTCYGRLKLQLINQLKPNKFQSMLWCTTRFSIWTNVHISTTTYYGSLKLQLRYQHKTNKFQSMLWCTTRFSTWTNVHISTTTYYGSLKLDTNSNQTNFNPCYRHQLNPNKFQSILWCTTRFSIWTNVHISTTTYYERLKLQLRQLRQLRHLFG
jgi:hypothetical protein